MAIEIEIVDLPIDSMVDLSMVFWDCLPEGLSPSTKIHG